MPEQAAGITEQAVIQGPRDGLKLYMPILYHYTCKCTYIFSFQLVNLISIELPVIICKYFITIFVNVPICSCQ